MLKQNSNQIIYTNKARCRDCYRCLRACPVKAIKMENNQAYIVEELCVDCGTCLRECPQGAKNYRKDLDRLQNILQEGGRVAVSIAPSFSAIYEKWKADRIPSILRGLGFSYISETSNGAYHVSMATKKLLETKGDRTYIASACPAVVTYIEKYYHNIIENITPIVSPMVAHAMLLKEKLGPETRVVFIGPCVAKKGEAQRKEYEGLIDCVITFEELSDWMDREKINFSNYEVSSFDDSAPGDSRYFPMAGGLLKTASIDTDHFSTKTFTITGSDEVANMTNFLKKPCSFNLIEPLFCHHGCIDGPAIADESNIFARRDRLIRYAMEKSQIPGKGTGEEMSDEALHTLYKTDYVEIPEVTEEEIRRVLKETGKAREEDQLNCKACGYNSCREKAIGVIRNMAVKEMCIPYMRRLAEQRTDRIMETSPNGIVIMNDKLEILHMNPAFRKNFMCSDAVLGKHISYLVDPEPFEKISCGKEELMESTRDYKKYNMICRQIAYSLKDEGQIVGIFVNITRAQHDKIQLERIKREAIMQAEELLEHQIEMAQNLAVFLGESTAKGEALVHKIINLVNKEPDRKER